MQENPNQRRRVSVAKAPGIFYRLSAKGERRYEFLYRDSDGSLRSKTVKGSLEDAKAARQDLLARMRKGERVAPRSVTFREFAEQWLEYSCSRPRKPLRDATTRSYRYRLDLSIYPTFENRRLQTITVDDVAAWVAKLHNEGKGHSLITASLNVFGSVMKHAVRRGLIPTNPVGGLIEDERPDIPERALRILDSDEIKRLLAAAAEHPLPLQSRARYGQPGRWLALFSTLLFTGIRIGEGLGLTWEDVDTTAGLIRVRKQLAQFKPRTYAPLKTPSAKRDVVMIESLAQILREHKAASAFKAPGDPVFCTADGKNLMREPVGTCFRLICDEAGVKRTRLHDLRHCYASLLIVGLKADPVFASKQLGHAKPSTTLDVYAALFDKARSHDAIRTELEAKYGSLIPRAGLRAV